MLKRQYSFEKYFFISDFEIEKPKINKLSQTMIIDSTDLEKKLEKFTEKQPSETILENNLKRTIKDMIHFSFQNNLNILESFSKDQIINSCITISDIKPEYIYIRKFNIPDNELFEKNIIDKYEDKFYEKLSNHILNLKIYFQKEITNHSIGPITEIEYLIEKYYNFLKDFKNEIEEKKNILKDIQYYRNIKGDGNCFYRCIIFLIFEYIILNNKINILKGFIYEIYQCYQDKFTDGHIKINSTNEIKGNLLIQILNVIYLKLKNNNIKDAYKIFISSINSCKTFDLGLIWYYRYTLGKYIKENMNKFFSPTFDILIGNLLPEEYEKNGRFMYEDFFDKYLYKLYSDAEKIVIYLTPYIFGININIFMFTGSKQKFTYEGESNFNLNFEINILNKDAHYEVLYLKTFYQKYKIYLETYLNIKPIISIFNEEEKTQMVFSELEKPIDERKRLNHSMMMIGKKINLNNDNNIDKGIGNNNMKNDKLIESKNKIINPTSVKQCPKCGLYPEILYNNTIFTGYCKICLSQFLYDYILSEYFIFLQNNPKKKFKLSIIEINFKGELIKFDQIFNLIEDKEIDKKKLKMDIKSRYCIICWINLSFNDKKIRLSCNCCICINCIIKKLNQIKNKNFYICPYCQVQYDFNYIHTLYLSNLPNNS